MPRTHRLVRLGFRFVKGKKLFCLDIKDTENIREKTGPWRCEKSA